MMSYKNKNLWETQPSQASVPFLYHNEACMSLHYVLRRNACKYVCNQINRLRGSRFFSIIDSKRVSEAALGVRKKMGRSGEGIS